MTEISRSATRRLIAQHASKPKRYDELLNFLREVEWLLNKENGEVTSAPDGCAADFIIDAAVAEKLHAEAVRWVKVFEGRIENETEKPQR